MIDEDQSDCGQEAKMDYELQLVTNMTTEVQTQLSTQADIALAASLKNFLSSIFTDFAHDISLSFYDTKGDSVRLYYDEHIMNDSEHSYTLYIPRQRYMHLAVANIKEDPVVRLENAENCHDAVLRQIDGDTINSHNTGIFTARLPMEMIEGIDQTFYVKLYMANCAAMLVVDPQDYDISGMRVFTTGFATAFHIADSVYEFKTPAPLIRTKRMEPDENGNVGFISVNFPSREPSTPQPAAANVTRTVIETTEPFIAQPGDEVLWEFRIYLPQSDGTITETILGIKEPLRAGQLKIVRVRINNGQVETENDATEVAISVTLDWKPGGAYNSHL
ncbi:MAG: hypothetical protein IK075_02725 [Prevotella sp.]|nr:hypothetical protein [Prevotella sp.]